MFENHISIKKVHETFPKIIIENFRFKKVSKDDVRKEICNLNVKKSSTYCSISASILKQCFDASLPYLTDSINYCLRESTFPQEIKYSEVIPVYKILERRRGIDELAFYLMYQSFLRESFINK